MANSGTKLHGKNGAIYINGPKGTGTKAAAKSGYTLNLGRDYVEATVFGETNKTYLTGLRDISGTWEGLMDVSGDLLVNLSSEDETDIYLYADDRDGEEVLLAWGPGLFDASIEASLSDAVRARGNFRAAGSWSVFTGV
jgi:hypothetical protein